MAHKVDALDGDPQLGFIRVNLGQEDLLDVLDDFRDVERIFLECENAVFEHSQVQHVVDESAHKLQVIYN